MQRMRPAVARQAAWMSAAALLGRSPEVLPLLPVPAITWWPRLLFLPLLRTVR